METVLVFKHKSLLSKTGKQFFELIGKQPLRSFNFYLCLGIRNEVLNLSCYKFNVKILKYVYKKIFNIVKKFHTNKQS